MGLRHLCGDASGEFSSEQRGSSVAGASCSQHFANYQHTRGSRQMGQCAGVFEDVKLGGCRGQR